jgi:hypothetical protein
MKSEGNGFRVERERERSRERESLFSLFVTHSLFFVSAKYE